MDIFGVGKIISPNVGYYYSPLPASLNEASFPAGSVSGSAASLHDFNESSHQEAGDFKPSPQGQRAERMCGRKPHKVKGRNSKQCFLLSILFQTKKKKEKNLIKNYLETLYAIQSFSLWWVIEQESLILVVLLSASGAHVCPAIV